MKRRKKKNNLISMNNNKKYLVSLWLILSFILGNNLIAQDLHFSQFYEAPLLRNPALAGLYEGDVRIQGIYKNQWNSISFPYQTGSINAYLIKILILGDTNTIFMKDILTRQFP
jgi:hypothetical protein